MRWAIAITSASKGRGSNTPWGRFQSRYDKFGLILRIETTVNDVSFFKHYRQVEHRNGSKEMKYADMLKTIYSLPALRQLLVAANRRYLEFLSAIEDDRTGSDK